MRLKASANPVAEKILPSYLTNNSMYLDSFRKNLRAIKIEEFKTTDNHLEPVQRKPSGKEVINDDDFKLKLESIHLNSVHHKEMQQELAEEVLSAMKSSQPPSKQDEKPLLSNRSEKSFRLKSIDLKDKNKTSNPPLAKQMASPVPSQSLSPVDQNNKNLEIEFKKKLLSFEIARLHERKTKLLEKMNDTDFRIEFLTNKLNNICSSDSRPVSNSKSQQLFHSQPPLHPIAEVPTGRQSNCFTNKNDNKNQVKDKNTKNVFEQASQDLLSLDQIELNETFFISNGDVGQYCNLCLEQLMDQERVNTLKCKHLLHKDCAEMWFRKKRHCPVCRMKQT